MNKLDVAAAGLRWSGVGPLLRATPVWQGVLVLNYHRIGNPADTLLDSDLFSASQDALNEQVAFLKRHFDVITPPDLKMVRERGRGRHVMITFDDGYRDNFELALPVLKAHGAPATFFICTGYIDDPKLPWWDEIAWMLRSSTIESIAHGDWLPHGVQPGIENRAAIRIALARYKELPGDKTAGYLDFLRSATGADASVVNGSELWMTWEMIRDLQRAGMTIGAHTVSHQLLGKLSEAEQEAEIVGSRDRIAAQIGIVPRAFAYPVGSRSAFTETTKRLLRKHGFESAFSFYGGFQRFDPFDPYDVRRAHVGYSGAQPVFEAMTTLPGLFARW